MKDFTPIRKLEDDCSILQDEVDYLREVLDLLREAVYFWDYQKAHRILETHFGETLWQEEESYRP